MKISVSHSGRLVHHVHILESHRDPDDASAIRLGRGVYPTLIVQEYA